ncbi:MAG: OmpA family protein [Saprospiraceae bacterium]
MRFLAFLLFLVFLLFAVFARWFFVCDILQQCAPVPVVDTLPADLRSKTLVLLEDTVVLLQGYDEFAFDLQSDQPIMNENNHHFLDTVAQLMQTDSNRQLLITGMFVPQEADKMAGFYENMGLARAAAIRDLLKQRGIPEDRIQMGHLYIRDSVLHSPLTFAFLPQQAPDEYAVASYSFTNMTYSDANFPSNGYEFTPTQAFISYADSVKTYMALHPDKVIRIIGHTDSDDTEAYNKKLGMKRAESTRQYLKELGISNKIEIASMGESQPVRPNDTPENKQKNRRINLVIE